MRLGWAKASGDENSRRRLEGAVGAETGLPEVVSVKASWPLGAVKPKPKTSMVAEDEFNEAKIVWDRP